MLFSGFWEKLWVVNAEEREGPWTGDGAIASYLTEFLSGLGAAATAQCLCSLTLEFALPFHNTTHLYHSW
jgi:hypothetical protein